MSVFCIYFYEFTYSGKRRHGCTTDRHSYVDGSHFLDLRLPASTNVHVPGKEHGQPSIYVSKGAGTNKRSDKPEVFTGVMELVEHRVMIELDMALDPQLGFCFKIIATSRRPQTTSCSSDNVTFKICSDMKPGSRTFILP